MRQTFDNKEEKNSARKPVFQKFDRSNLPAQKFLSRLMESELSKKYLVIGEAVLAAALAGTIWLYYFR